MLVLTETKDSVGCRLHADAFTAAGYHVAYPKPENGDYGVMIASKLKASTDGFSGRVGYLSSRAAAITLAAPGGPIHIVGAYVPSRDASAEKTERKRKWLDACHAALASRPSSAAVFLGDFNVLEPRPPAALLVLRAVRVRLLPAAHRRLRPGRRLPHPAPRHGRAQLGRPHRRRLPLRPRPLHGRPRQQPARLRLRPPAPPRPVE
ncbi:MAG: hypothetical protein ACRDT0_07525 [Pseudonocardiaceae bacterium]